MINGNLDQFLDTGWYSEATLYYKGYVYWLEGFWNDDIQKYYFYAARWQAQCDDLEYYHEYRDASSNELCNYAVVFENTADCQELNKKAFLTAKIFDGRTFWEVEHEIAWVEPDKPVYK